MVTFLILYILYWIEHFYVFLKIKTVFPMDTGMSILLGSFLFFMTLSPLLIHLYSIKGSQTLSKIFAYIGYIWMALILFFFTTSVFFDLYNLIIRMAGFLLQKDLSRIILSPLFSFFLPLFISILMTTYGYFEAKNLHIERVSIKTSKLPMDINKLTIAHISDLHLGLLVRERTLEKVLKKIENIKPDLIVSTGDLVDGEINHIDCLTEMLKRAHARLGKFAVTGNHEFFAGVKQSLKFIEDAGFTVLRGTGVTVQDIINIVGIDDPLIKDQESSKNPLSKFEKKILSQLPSDKFTLLLKHRPVVDEDSLGLFDLQLSGHTHKGQMFPINLVTRFIFHSHAGYRNLPKGSAIYVNRGAGTTCSPVRFLSPPEIAVIELISTTGNQEINTKRKA